MDPHVVARMSGGSMNAYRTAVRAFLAFLLFYNLAPVDGPQMDDFLLEWKVGTDMPPGLRTPSKSQFEH